MVKGLDGAGGGEILGEEVGGGVAEEAIFEVWEEEAARHGRRRRRRRPRWLCRPRRNGVAEGNDVDDNDSLFRCHFTFISPS